MVVFDASILLLVLDPATRAPQGVEFAAKRVEHLMLDLESGQTAIGVPTPVLSEVMVKAGAMYDAYLRTLSYRHFVVLPFDYHSALEAANAIAADGLRAGAGGSGATRAKIKFDRQIVAIAKVNGADAIYSDDKSIIRHAHRAGLAARRSADLDMPPERSRDGGP